MSARAARRYTLLIALPALVPGPAALHAQEPLQNRVPLHSAGQGAVSAAVVASWSTDVRPGGTGELAFVVLWRGADRWHFGPISGGGPTSMGGSMRRRTVMNGVVLEFDYDAERRIMSVLGHEIALDTANVVMVDRIDGVGGPPYVYGTARVEPEVGNYRDPLPDVWRRSQQARAFVPSRYRPPLDLLNR